MAGRGYLHAGRFIMNGYSAVTLFFMLSGFILAYNYRGQIETRHHTFRFWEARFARIWPAYVFSLFCSSFPPPYDSIFPSCPGHAGHGAVMESSASRIRQRVEFRLLDVVGGGPSST